MLLGDARDSFIKKFYRAQQRGLVKVGCPAVQCCRWHRTADHRVAELHPVDGHHAHTCMHSCARYKETQRWAGKHKQELDQDSIIGMHNY